MQKKKIFAPLFQFQVVGHFLDFSNVRQLRLNGKKCFLPEHLWVLYVANDIASKLRTQRQKQISSAQKPVSLLQGFPGNFGALIYEGAQGEVVLQNYTRSSGTPRYGAMNSLFVASISAPIFNAYPRPGEANGRTHDSEFVLLNYLAINNYSDLEQGGRITFFTSRPPCHSCRIVIQNFLHNFKNVKISLYFMNNRMWVKKPDYQSHGTVRKWSRKLLPRLQITQLNSRCSKLSPATTALN